MQTNAWAGAGSSPTPGSSRLAARRLGKTPSFPRRPRRSSRGARRAWTASRTRASGGRSGRKVPGSSPTPGSVRSRVREARPSARLRRRSRRAPAAASSGPRTATRPRAFRASCPGSTTSPTATSARCSGRAVTTAAVATAPRLQMEDCALRDGFGRAADVDVPSDSPLGWSKLAAFLAPRDLAATADTWKTCSVRCAARGRPVV